MKRNGLKGLIFEILVLRLVLDSGYHIIPRLEKNKMKLKRKRFLEYKGRGCYHQIDIPCDSDYSPDFMYPIRLLGEVKAYEDKVSKDTIRMEIGKMKDIQENYFVDKDLTLEMRQNRRTEIFSIFSLNGFNIEAEKLAYAHNLKTISFAENDIMQGLLENVMGLVEYLSKYEYYTQNKILDELFYRLILNRYPDYIYNQDNYFELSNDYINSFNQKEELSPLIDSVDKVKEVILGQTKSGLSIMFFSKENIDFESVFAENDTAKCKIFSDDNRHWFLQIKDNPTLLSFSMPEIALDEKITTLYGNIYPKKKEVFEEIHFVKKIKGVERHLSFVFDSCWFDRLR